MIVLMLCEAWIHYWVMSLSILGDAPQVPIPPLLSSISIFIASYSELRSISPSFSSTSVAYINSFWYLYGSKDYVPYILHAKFLWEELLFPI